ncbi:MAG: LptF/LptG family permease [Caulobacterales bacterium]
MKLIDRYALRLVIWPLTGALVITLLALILERILRLLDALSDSNDRFGYTLQLAANLIPHYLGLTLPAGFFIALFLVINKLNDGSEVDALLAAGVSPNRLVAPYVGAGVALMLASLFLFGVAQPYARYAFRGVMHAAENAGWNGFLQPQTLLSAGRNLTITADEVDMADESLHRVFIRHVSKNGREEVTTAKSAQLYRSPDGESVTIEMKDGYQLIASNTERPRLLTFDSFGIEVSLKGAPEFLRGRGGDERELTMFELAQRAELPNPLIPKQILLSELYSRLARSFALPFLPLLALPLGLAAKRSGRAPGIIIGGLTLLVFQHSLQFGHGLTESGRATAAMAIGVPFFTFAALSVAVFASSRKRPGETPISLLVQKIGDVIRAIRGAKA